MNELEVRNVYTRETIAKVPLADEREIDSAIDAAHRAFATTRTLPHRERSETLRAAAEGIERHARELADLIVAEAGKPVTLAEAEVARAVVTFKCASEEASRATEEPIDADAFPQGKGHTGFYRRFPVGVVYGMTPFNFPLNLVAHKVAPAIATGNTIVVKPSPRTPLTAMKLGEILKESGVPAGQVNVIVAPNEIATRPLSDPRVKHVSFTGSAPIGWEIKSKAKFQRVTLELGGNAGLIVHEDADVKAAVIAAATGGFAYAGQSCISVQRVAVQRSIYEAFRDALVQYVASEIHAGDPTRRDVIVGPMIDEAASRRIAKMIEDATARGAKLLCGGRLLEHNIFEPTILENVDSNLAIVRTEVFGPVVTLHSYENFDDAIAFVNDSDFGLQAGVFTRDANRIAQAFEQLEVGGVMINQSPTFRLENMPYGGVKQSGHGREGVRWAMQEMTEPRVMLTKHS